MSSPRPRRPGAGRGGSRALALCPASGWLAWQAWQAAAGSRAAPHMTRSRERRAAPPACADPRRQHPAPLVVRS